MRHYINWYQNLLALSWKFRVKRPIKIETLNVLESYDKDIDFTYHSTKLLPEYCFPLGLNIIDKMTKVPSWMRSSMRNEYQDLF